MMGKLKSFLLSMNFKIFPNRLFLYAKYDAEQDNYTIFSYDKEETAFSFARPLFSLQRFSSSQNFYSFFKKFKNKKITVHFGIWDVKIVINFISLIV